MAKYKCTACNKEVDLSTQTIVVKDGNIVCKEAVCCDKYMSAVKGKFEGFGGIIKKGNGSVGGKF